MAAHPSTANFAVQPVGRINVCLGSRLLQSFAAHDLDLDDPALEAA
jgi:hypothetical protein